LAGTTSGSNKEDRLRVASGGHDFFGGCVMEAGLFLLFEIVRLSLGLRSLGFIVPWKSRVES
jgi:hypothetical protein